MSLIVHQSSYAEAKRLLTNVVGSEELALRLMEAAEVAGCEDLVAALRSDPGEFGLPHDTALKGERSRAVLGTLLTRLVDAKWQLDLACAEEERLLRASDPCRPPVVMFDGRKAVVDLDAETATYLDGEQETVRLNVERDDMGRGRSRS